MTEHVKDNPTENRFELTVEGHIAAAYYRKEPGVIVFTHTEVPAALGGKGVGSKLIRGALEMVRNEGLRLVAQCPFVAAFMGKNPEFNDLLNGAAASTKKHLDEQLDEALEESFPASDPIAVDPRPE